MTIHHYDHESKFALTWTDQLPDETRVMVVDLADNQTYQTSYNEMARESLPPTQNDDGYSPRSGARPIPYRVLRDFVGEVHRQLMITQLQEKSAKEIWHEFVYEPYLNAR